MNIKQLKKKAYTKGDAQLKMLIKNYENDKKKLRTLEGDNKKKFIRSMNRTKKFLEVQLDDSFTDVEKLEMGLKLKIEGLADIICDDEENKEYIENLHGIVERSKKFPDELRVEILDELNDDLMEMVSINMEG
jgi:hypothetical protein